MSGIRKSRASYGNTKQPIRQLRKSCRICSFYVGLFFINNKGGAESMKKINLLIAFILIVMVSACSSNSGNEDEQTNEDVTKKDELVLAVGGERSEEHTSELQSRGHIVCSLLLERKNKLS